MEMTITEGLKRLKLLEKRMARNCGEIERYSSILSNEKPAFDTEEKQKQEVKSLIQANMDLVQEYEKLKASIDYTNLVIKVKIGDQTRTIHGWLTILRKTGQLLIQTYNSLSTRDATSRQPRYRDQNTGQSPTVVRLYDENQKRDGQRLWEDLTKGKEVEGRLEVINATTQLLDPPEPVERS
jgi:hypothetical protein